jgi:hypothetical protein
VERKSLSSPVCCLVHAFVIVPNSYLSGGGGGGAGGPALNLSCVNTGFGGNGGPGVVIFGIPLAAGGGGGIAASSSGQNYVIGTNCCVFFRLQSKRAWVMWVDFI